MLSQRTPSAGTAPTYRDTEDMHALDAVPQYAADSSGKPMLSRMYQYFGLGVNLILFVLLIVLYSVDEHYRDNSFVLTSVTTNVVHTTYDSKDYFWSFLSISGDAVWSNSLALAFVPLLAAIGQGIELWYWSGKVEQALKRRNVIRWVADSLTVPLLATCILVPLGDFTTFSLLAAFTLTHVVTLLGAFMEVVNTPADRSGTTQVPLLFSGWINALAYIPVLTMLIITDDLSHVTAVEWVSIAFFIAYQMIGTVIQMSYYSYLACPTKGYWPFDLKAGAVANFKRYDNLLNLNAIITRGVVVLLAMGNGLMNDFWFFPSVITTQSTFSQCALSGAYDPSGYKSTTGEAVMFAGCPFEQLNIHLETSNVAYVAPNAINVMNGGLGPWGQQNNGKFGYGQSTLAGSSTSSMAVTVSHNFTNYEAYSNDACLYFVGGDIVGSGNFDPIVCGASWLPEDDPNGAAPSYSSGPVRTRQRQLVGGSAPNTPTPSVTPSPLPPSVAIGVQRGYSGCLCSVATIDTEVAFRYQPSYPSDSHVGNKDHMVGVIFDYVL